MPHPIRILFFLALPSALLFGGSADTARSLFEEQRYAEAEAAYKTLAAEQPTDAEAQYYLGRLAVMHDSPKEATLYLEKAASLSPANSTYFMWLGNAYGVAALKAGLFDKASLAKKSRLAYEKAVALDPESIDARLALVGFYDQAPSIVGGGMDKARVQAQEVKKRDATKGNLALAEISAREKNYEQAFALYEEILKTSPDNYVTLYQFGRMAGMVGQQLDRGEEHLRHCLTLNPGPNDTPKAIVTYRLGVIAEKKSDLTGARMAFEQSLRLDPEYRPASIALERVKNSR